MAKRTDAFPSRFLRAADLGNRAVTVKIASANFETLKNHQGEEQRKLVLAFDKTKKVFVVNMTNFDLIAEATGQDDSDYWSGHSVELYPTVTTVGSKRVDCIRVRASSSNDAAAVDLQPKPSVKEDLDDEIPF